MADTLREFLISVGFDLKEGDEKRLLSGLRNIEIQAKLAADSIEAFARTVWEKVSDVATAFDRMYFSSQRIGMSASNIEAVKYAVGQLGGSAEAAQASLEAMGQKLRENPGNIYWVNSVGIGLNKVTHQLEYQHDLLEKFKSLPSATQELLRKGAGRTKRHISPRSRLVLKSGCRNGATIKRALALISIRQPPTRTNLRPRGETSRRRLVISLPILL